MNVLLVCVLGMEVQGRRGKVCWYGSQRRDHGHQDLPGTEIYYDRQQRWCDFPMGVPLRVVGWICVYLARLDGLVVMATFGRCCSGSECCEFIAHFWMHPPTVNACIRACIRNKV